MAKDDKTLVSQLLAGDEQAFREFFDEYFDRLYRFAMARTRGETDLSEEASQRALCRAVRRLDSFRGDASLFSWLAQICRNELADLLEARQRRPGMSVSTRKRAHNGKWPRSAKKQAQALRRSSSKPTSVD
jgi:RNA polymerase sigma-70 factor, ECF subfamily